jgi:hypothetical protein
VPLAIAVVINVSVACELAEIDAPDTTELPPVKCDCPRDLGREFLYQRDEAFLRFWRVRERLPAIAGHLEQDSGTAIFTRGRSFPLPLLENTEKKRGVRRTSLRLLSGWRGIEGRGDRHLVTCRDGIQKGHEQRDANCAHVDVIGAWHGEADGQKRQKTVRNSQPS